jgi:hypothetical protein
MTLFDAPKSVILRTPPHAGESEPGYFTRVQQRFCIRSVNQLVDCTPRDEATKADFMLRLASMTGAHMDQMADLTRTVFSRKGATERVLVEGHLVQSLQFVDMRQVRICPKCVSEAGYIRGRWHLTLLRACERHATELISSCPKCRRALSPTSISPHRCACGHHLSKLTSDAASAHDLIVSRLITNAVGREEPMAQLALPSFVDGLSLENTLRLVWFLGHVCTPQFLFQANGHKRRPLDSEVDGLNARAIDALLDWPHCFTNCWNAEIAPIIQEAESKRPTSAIGPIHRYAKTLQNEPLLREVVSLYNTLAFAKASEEPGASSRRILPSPQLPLFDDASLPDGE